MNKEEKIENSTILQSETGVKMPPLPGCSVSLGMHRVVKNIHYSKDWYMVIQSLSAQHKEFYFSLQLHYDAAVGEKMKP